MCFRKYENNGSTRIAFRHLNETEAHYDHEWATVRDYLLTREVVVSNYISYFGAIIQDLPDQPVL